MLRKINTLIKHGQYEGIFRVYGLEENLDYLKYSCKFLLNDLLSESSDLENRAKKYTEEAMLHFSGNIFVPEDLDVIRIL